MRRVRRPRLTVTHDSPVLPYEPYTPEELASTPRQDVLILLCGIAIAGAVVGLIMLMS